MSVAVMLSSIRMHWIACEICEGPTLLYTTQKIVTKSVTVFRAEFEQ